MFEEETSGFDQHPGDLLSDDIQQNVLLERSGIYDPESSDVSGRHRTAAAIHGFAQSTRKDDDPVLLTYERDPINEYNNRNLFPGMFPTLFPLGIGGFEDRRRDPPVSLKAHAEHLLDQSARNFRSHYFYPFVVLNMIQRRTAHLHTSFSVKSEKFANIAPALLSVTPSTLSNLASHLKDEWKLDILSIEEQNALRLLREVNVVSAKIPGSQASKLSVRHEIRSYFGYFGMPHLFFTFNPSAVHSPVFQVIYGDESVDLSDRFPDVLKRRSERALRVAKDPVAAADFFEFMYVSLFRDLFGWDFDKGRSSEIGGVFGRLHAFYGTAE
ncbi:hypothetical protein BT96DRAFT_833421, partial [Gymnopus androsaceus JB14]